MKARDLFILASEAYKAKRYEESAQLFVAVMEDSGCDAFLHSILEDGEHEPVKRNLISESGSFKSLQEIVNSVAATFKSESSYLEDGDEVFVTQSFTEDEEDSTEDENTEDLSDSDFGELSEEDFESESSEDKKEAVVVSPKCKIGFR